MVAVIGMWSLFGCGRWISFDRTSEMQKSVKKHVTTQYNKSMGGGR